MKTLLLTISLVLTCSFIQAQTVNDIIKTDIRVNATPKQLKEGLKKLEDKCAEAPEDNCNKGKAFAMYLLADYYYQVATSLKGLDVDLEAQAVNKAIKLYDSANLLLPAADLNPSNARLLLDDKNNYENNQ